MNLFVLSMAMTVASNVLYHLCQKGISPTVNPITSLIVSYVCALLICLAAYPAFYPASDFVESFKSVNWASFVIAFGLIGLELGFLLAYRAGWNLSLAALYSNVAVGLALLPIGILFWKEQLTVRSGLGLVFALIGLVLMSQKNP